MSLLGADGKENTKSVSSGFFFQRFQIKSIKTIFIFISVNIESKGRIKFRQKLSDVPETGITASKISAVPFPKNLKTRHPLFGASYEDKI